MLAREIKTLMAWNGLKVSDFCALAGISHGTFYKVLHDRHIDEKTKERVMKVVDQLKRKQATAG